MHISSVHLTAFKRFTDTTFSGIPAAARLVVLAGPNGSGKSSLFDGLKTWHRLNGGPGGGWDETYGAKVGTPSISWPQHVQVAFHEPIPDGPDDRKRLIYVRTAFRNEADFSVSSFNRLGSPLDQERTQRMIDNDVAVSENYQRLLMQTIDGVYDESLPADMPRVEIRDRIIGQVRDAMRAVFPDLELTGVGGVSGSAASEGTFYFAKGSSQGFLYKNLSAGEKAAFDLLLDAVIKREYFNDSIWCIDEPETHLNSRIQANLLVALVGLLPDGCQLWLASHSIGFMRKAWELAKTAPDSVAFIDMEGVEFDGPVTLVPIQPSRDFWARTLNVALGDMAALVAPEHVVLCEGRPSTGPGDINAAYDAECYRTIFKSTHPGADFISVGNSTDTSRDRLGVGRAIQTIASGTIVTRVVDRDYKSETEIAALEAIGTRVLNRRHIEAYLFDAEVIAELCTSEGALDKINEAEAIRTAAIAASVERGNDPDDIKRAAGTIADGLRRLLSLANAGSNAEAFARDALARHLLPRMAAYQELDAVIFGERSGAAS